MLGNLSKKVDGGGGYVGTVAGVGPPGQVLPRCKGSKCWLQVRARAVGWPKAMVVVMSRTAAVVGFLHAS